LGKLKQNPLSKEGGFLFVLFTIHYSFSKADFEYSGKAIAGAICVNRQWNEYVSLL